MGFLGECVGCEEGGICYCTGLGEDTWRHGSCYTRISDLDEFGQPLADALGCDVGCRPCMDYPNDIIAHAAARGLVHQPGWRFLLPAAQDARGMMHELLAHQPHLVQLMMEYHRAANHDNYTHECVDEEDVPCETWPWVEYGSGDPILYCNGAIVGSPIHNYFGEGFFYHGKWPQRAATQQLDCRKFPHNALRAFNVTSDDSNTIFLTSDTQGDGCGADWLIPGAGYVVTSPCGAGYSHLNDDVPDEDSPAGYAYARYLLGGGSPCATLFDHISVVSNNATFRNRDGLDPHDVDLHNAILRKVREPGTFERVEFDRLDHEANTPRKNAGLGRFSRTWDGTGYNITDPRLPVVRSYPPRFSRTKWFNVPVTAQLVIVKMWFVIDMALPHTKRVIPDVGTILFDRYEYIEPHCVARIHVWLGLRVTIDENEHGVEAVYTEGQSGIWPDITPPGNELLIAQKGTPWQWPPAFVEWQGVLNNFSDPSLHSQGYPRQVGDEDFSIHGPYGRSLKSACAALGTWRVPGAPVQIDFNSDDPNQHWIGELRFNFTDSDNYRMCVA